MAPGHHAIEFLLWGQDLNGTGPGAGDRPWTDFAMGDACTNAAAFLRPWRISTDGFARIGEFDTSGIGPHELAQLADGKTLAVSKPTRTVRAKLNLPTTQLKMSFIDAVTSDLIARHALPHGSTHLASTITSHGFET